MKLDVESLERRNLLNADMGSIDVSADMGPEFGGCGQSGKAFSGFWDCVTRTLRDNGIILTVSDGILLGLCITGCTGVTGGVGAGPCVGGCTGAILGGNVVGLVLSCWHASYGNDPENPAEPGGGPAQEKLVESGSSFENLEVSDAAFEDWELGQGQPIVHADLVHSDGVCFVGRYGSVSGTSGGLHVRCGFHPDLDWRGGFVEDAP